MTLTESYNRLDREAIDKIDAAIFSGDIFFDRENIASLRGMMTRWETALKSIESILDESEKNKENL